MTVHNKSKPKSQYKNRIKELRWVKASELTAHPQNWRLHPQAQKDALTGILKEVGWADVLKARVTKSGYELIDGHLRAGLDPEALVPVVILDVNEDDAMKLLATIDPIAAMARTDEQKLTELYESIHFDSKEIEALLESITKGETNPLDEWNQMPEYSQEDQSAWKSLTVNFNSKKDLDAFAQVIGQPLTEKTRSVWFPEAEIGHMVNKRYKAEGAPE